MQSDQNSCANGNMQQSNEILKFEKKLADVILFYQVEFTEN